MTAIQVNLFQPIHLPEMEEAALEVLRTGQIHSGRVVANLESAFEGISHRKNIVATSNLTSALQLALTLAGVGAGDEVATLAFSCLQSTSPISHLGARPVWIDIDPQSMSMCTEDLKRKLSPKIKAVFAYHISGYPSNSIEIAKVCSEFDIPLIEDCNNAIGATLNGKPLGTFGNYAVYSLYPNRQINGIDGGVLSTPNPETAALARRLRRFGVDSVTFRDHRGEINPDSEIHKIGWSAAPNDLNAAVALAQIRTLSLRILRTQEIAKHLTHSFSNLKKIRLVKPISCGTPAYWSLLVMSEKRDLLLQHLRSHGIQCSLLHQRNDIYSGFGVPKQNLPGTESAMNHMLALPCGHWLTDSQLTELTTRIVEFERK